MIGTKTCVSMGRDTPLTFIPLVLISRSFTETKKVETSLIVPNAQGSHVGDGRRATEHGDPAERFGAYAGRGIFCCSSI